MLNRNGCPKLGLIRAVACDPAGTGSAAIAAGFTPLAWLSCEKARRLLLAVAILNIAFPVGRHLGFREEMAAFGALGGFSFTLTTIALAGLYLPRLMPAQRVASAGAMRFSGSMPLALYLLFSAFSLLGASDIMLGLYEVFFIVQLFLLHLYIASSVNLRDDVLLIIRYMLIGLIAQGLLMIALAGGLAELNFLNAKIIPDSENPGEVTREVNIFGLKARIDENIATGQSRIGGSIGSSNNAAGYLAGTMAIALGVLLSSLGRRYKLLAGIGVGLGGAALVLTFSRGGWIAFVLILIIMAFFGLRHRQYSWMLPLGLAVALVLMIGVSFNAAISARLTEDDNGAAISRVPLMKLAALMIRDHPLLGVGANNFPIAMQEYVTRGFSGEFLYSVHNKYLLVLSETGPGGFLAFVWFLVSMSRRGVRCCRYADPLISPLATGCLAALAGEMLHMFVDTFRGEPILQLLCVISALLVLLERLAARRSESRRDGNHKNSRAGDRICSPALT